jgi:hypothetical protein
MAPIYSSKFDIVYLPLRPISLRVTLFTPWDKVAFEEIGFGDKRGTPSGPHMGANEEHLRDHVSAACPKHYGTM